MIRAIPFLAALPLVIVWLGVGEAEKIFLVALGVTFPIYINTTLGIRQVDPKLLELGRVQGLSTLELIRRIICRAPCPRSSPAFAMRSPRRGSLWSSPKPSAHSPASGSSPWTHANSSAPT